jgi:hypothetical protein
MCVCVRVCYLMTLTLWVTEIKKYDVNGREIKNDYGVLWNDMDRIKMTYSEKSLSHTTLYLRFHMTGLRSNPGLSSEMPPFRQELFIK